MKEKLETIRKACIETNPEKEWVSTTMHGGEEYSDDVPVCLADVLLAIDKNYSMPMFVDERGWFWKQERIKTRVELKATGIQFNLKDDDLEHQSKETIEFIHSLLQ